ncbi:MAG: TIGR03663 family protein [Candidatus Omnitrophota bacterium]|jgi:uncharacterized protein (TIGR03663 family)|nr:MAG: TIGR03663 family protein [Candidatus Omnitrophota bacterium]
MSQDSYRITKYGLYVAIILLFAAFIRLAALDRMAFHHDESIHAFYSHMIYKGNLQGYAYNPVYHGPFLYHYGALFFLLFGDNDFVARLPFVSFGLLLFYFIWRMKPYIGKAGVLSCMLLIAVSPTMTYFARFARNDIYMATMAMGIIVYGLEYLRLRRNRDLALMTFFLALMYSCKENSYMTGFFLGSYIVFYGFYYIFSYPREGRKRALYEIFDQRSPFVKVLTIYAVYSCFAFTLVRHVVKNWQLPPTFDQNTQNTMNVLHSTWDNYTRTHPWILPLWIFTAVAVVLGLFILYAWIRRKAAPETETITFFERFAYRNVAVLSCILVALAVYSVLFTTLGTNRSGMKAGVVDYLLYWMFQQDHPRIGGSSLYFFPRLVIYEILAVVFAAAAFFVYTFRGLGLVNFVAFQTAFWGLVYAYSRYFLAWIGTLQQAIFICLLFFCLAGVIFISKKLAAAFSFIPKESEEGASPMVDSDAGLLPDGIRCFFIYWSVGSVLVYALLQEKVPWLLVHQAQPLLLLAGVFIGDLWSRLRPGVLRTIFVIVVGLFVTYEARTDIWLNLYNNDDPRETMVYTQTDHSIKAIVAEIERGAELLGAEYMPPNPTKVIAGLQGEANWPYAWYLRNYRTYPQSKGLPPADVPYALVDDEYLVTYGDQMKVWAKGQYTRRLIKHRVWWPPLGQSEVPFLHFNKQHEAWKALYDYVLYRKVWGGQPGSENVLFYAKTPLIEPEAKIEGPQGADQMPKPLQIIGSVGKHGFGEGDFNQPRGIALSPDESRVYVLDALNGRVQAYDSDLNYIGYFGGPGVNIGEFTINQGNGPNGGIGVGPDGVVFITDTWAETFTTLEGFGRVRGSGRIIRYRPSAEGGEFLPPITQGLNQLFFSPRGLAMAADGTLLISDTGNKKILRFRPDGTYDGTIGEGELNEPVGIAVGADGLVYVCDVGNMRVAAFTRNGQFARQWAMTMGWKYEKPVDMLWIEPYVAVDQQGNVYVSDSTTHMIFRFDRLGKQVAKWGGFGTGPGNLNGPKGIAVDSKGFLYIADSMNHRVIKTRMQ